MSGFAPPNWNPLVPARVRILSCCTLCRSRSSSKLAQRRRAGHSLNRLCDRCEVMMASIRWLVGGAGIIDVVARLARALKTTPDRLLVSQKKGARLIPNRARCWADHFEHHPQRSSLLCLRPIVGSQRNADFGGRSWNVSTKTPGERPYTRIPGVCRNPWATFVMQAFVATVTRLVINDTPSTIGSFALGRLEERAFCVR